MRAIELERGTHDGLDKSFRSFILFFFRFNSSVMIQMVSAIQKYKLLIWWAHQCMDHAQNLLPSDNQ